MAGRVRPTALVVQLIALLTTLPLSAICSKHNNCSDVDIPDGPPWCIAAVAALKMEIPSPCSLPGELGRALRSECPKACGVCEVAGGQLLDKALQAGGTVEYRTGFILPDPRVNSVSSAARTGWEAWLARSNATTTGFPVGNGFVKIKHTTIVVPNRANCDEFEAAARRLVDEFKIDAAVLLSHNCKTRISKLYSAAGVIHLCNNGNNLMNDDGSPWVSEYLWYSFLRSAAFPRTFLRSMAARDFRKVAVVWWDENNWIKSSAQYVMLTDIPLHNMELVYSHGWKQGGNALSLVNSSEYVELYNTTAWDRMLTEMSEAGTEVAIVYSRGEGASILKRIKALGIKLKGIYMTVSPTLPGWAEYMGDDADNIVTPGHWFPDLSTPCVVFGSSTEYVRTVQRDFGITPNYLMAVQTAAGIVLQRALQRFKSTDPRNVLAALQTLDEETMFGRVRFSLDGRNIGRDPLTTQWQNNRSRVVFPEYLATASFRDFVDWDCRALLKDTDGNVCSDEEYAIFEGCREQYPGLIDAQACLARQESEAAVRSRWLLAAYTLLAALAFAAVASYATLVISRRKHAKKALIDFNTVNVKLDRQGLPVLVQSSPRGEGVTLMGHWKGHEVVLQPLPGNHLSMLAPSPLPCMPRQLRVTQVGALTWQQDVAAYLELRHNNVLDVYGVSIDQLSNTVYEVIEWMPLGNLYNTIRGQRYLLQDWTKGIAHGIISGMKYLHSQEPQFVHGALRAKHILLDEKMTPKIRIGIGNIKTREIEERRKRASFRFSMHDDSGPSMQTAGTAWDAPEVLMGRQPTCASDVYSIGITLWELFTGKDPYENEGAFDPLRIPAKLRRRIIQDAVRPQIPVDTPRVISDLIESCWQPDPACRPSAHELLRLFESISSHISPHRSSTDMEILVNQMLPPHVSAALAVGRKVEPESFENVTVFFSDIVGFTDISAALPPTKVMDMLDRLYRAIDQVCVMYDLFKVETIGDAYMCVGGLAKPQEDHTARMACFALEVVEVAGTIAVDEQDPSMGYVTIRAGMHSGPVVASVVGDLNPRYCLFGDTINTASRMESNSEAGKINLSPFAQQCLVAQSPDFAHQCVSRGRLKIKGKGTMECFFLEPRRNEPVVSDTDGAE